MHRTPDLALPYTAAWEVGYAIGCVEHAGNIPPKSPYRPGSSQRTCWALGDYWGMVDLSQKYWRWITLARPAPIPPVLAPEPEPVIEIPAPAVQ